MFSGMQIMHQGSSVQGYIVFVALDMHTPFEGYPLSIGPPVFIVQGHGEKQPAIYMYIYCRFW